MSSTFTIWPPDTDRMKRAKLEKGSGLLLALACLAGCTVGGRHASRLALEFAEGRLSVAEVEQVAESGDATAQFLTALSYETGNGVAEDLVAARRWYEAAARQEHPAALNNLGLMHFHGRGVERSHATARTLLERSADSGFAQGQVNFAIVCLYGDDREPDVQLATRVLRRAARNGHVPALMLLATI
jgi:TPR repeat protein